MHSLPPLHSHKVECTCVCRLLHQENARGQTARCNEMGCERHLRAAATHLVRGRCVPERVLAKMLANQHLKIMLLRAWARSYPGIDAHEDDPCIGSSSTGSGTRASDVYAAGPDSSVLLGQGRLLSQDAGDAHQVTQLLHTFLSPGGGLLSSRPCQ